MDTIINVGYRKVFRNKIQSILQIRYCSIHIIFWLFAAKVFTNIYGRLVIYFFIVGGKWCNILKFSSVFCYKYRHVNRMQLINISNSLLSYEIILIPNNNDFFSWEVCMK